MDKEPCLENTLFNPKPLILQKCYSSENYNLAKCHWNCLIRHFVKLNTDRYDRKWDLAFTAFKTSQINTKPLSQESTMCSWASMQERKKWKRKTVYPKHQRLRIHTLLLGNNLQSSLKHQSKRQLQVSKLRKIRLYVTQGEKRPQNTPARTF